MKNPLRSPSFPRYPLRALILPALLLGLGTTAWAGGVRGLITDTDGNPLAFASVYVAETGSGTTSNEEGRYDITLPAGDYRLVFQYLGYESRTERVSVGSDYRTLNVQLTSQVLDLKEVEIYEGREDPAYTVMRKAIAKADYHREQVERYTAQVYIKGSGRLLKTPGILRKAIEKEGIDSSGAFVSESVSEIEFQRPNTYKERVISVYQQGENDQGDPQQFVFGSFYSEKINEAISPLSTRAFAYYRFSLEGYFQDRGFGVNKIRVEPRSRGDNVFDGYIYIIEDLWNIHSLDLATYIYGIRFDVRQVYAPIQERVWMPVTSKIDITGKVLGFGFEYRYLSTISDYAIELNPDLPDEVALIDEKIVDAPAAVAESEASSVERLTQGEPVTRKELKKILREIEQEENKEERAEREEGPPVESNYRYTVDSLAGKRDSSYWAEIRPIPLTKYEVVGYQRRDSIAQASVAAEAGDTTATGRRKKNNGLSWEDIVIENSFRLAEGTYIDWRGPLTYAYFNPIEGWPIAGRLAYRKSRDSTYFTTGVHGRYGLAWQRMTFLGDTEYRWGPQHSPVRIRLEGGRYLQQINDTQPISSVVNMLAALWFKRSYLRLYERRFGEIDFQKRWRRNVRLDLGVRFEDRTYPRNYSDYSVFGSDERGYAPNVPVIASRPTPDLSRQRALIADLGLRWRPWQRYRIRNGKLQPIDDNSPTLSLNYERAFAGAFDATADYDLLEFTYDHKFSIGVRGLLGIRLNAGLFLTDTEVAVPDMKHFRGNEIFLTTGNPTESFRLLPYYEQSTDDRFVAVNTHYQFRKFLLSRIWELQLTGLRENVFVNYLYTPTSENYTELGYSIDNIFRIFRVELAFSFQDGRYRDWGVLVGVASTIGGGLVSFD